MLWVHASSLPHFEQSCRNIADRVKIPGRQNPEANVFKLLHNWLHSESKGKWVLVLDNVDNNHFLHRVPRTKQDGCKSNQSCITERSIWAYFPKSLKGSIFITSRSRQTVSRMVEDSDIIIVKPMDEAHAIVLFEKKLEANTPRKEIV